MNEINWEDELKKVSRYDEYMKIMHKPTPPIRCAVIVDSTKERCPEVGVHDMGDGDYLCDKCFRAWNIRHKKSKEGEIKYIKF